MGEDFWMKQIKGMISEVIYKRCKGNKMEYSVLLHDCETNNEYRAEFTTSVEFYDSLIVRQRTWKQYITLLPEENKILIDYKNCPIFLTFQAK